MPGPSSSRNRLPYLERGAPPPRPTLSGFDASLNMSEPKYFAAPHLSSFPLMGKVSRVARRMGWSGHPTPDAFRVSTLPIKGREAFLGLRLGGRCSGRLGCRGGHRLGPRPRPGGDLPAALAAGQGEREMAVLAHGHALFAVAVG